MVAGTVAAVHRVNVELLYFDGCPHGESYLPHLSRLVADARPGARLDVRTIADDAEARAAGFLGSPTVRVDGRDIDPGASGRSDYALTCRVYRTEEGVHGTPPDGWVLRALTESDASA